MHYFQYTAHPVNKKKNIGTLEEARRVLSERERGTSVDEADDLLKFDDQQKQDVLDGILWQARIAQRLAKKFPCVYAEIDYQLTRKL